MAEAAEHPIFDLKRDLDGSGGLPERGLGDVEADAQWLAELVSDVFESGDSANLCDCDADWLDWSVGEGDEGGWEDEDGGGDARFALPYAQWTARRLISSAPCVLVLWQAETK